MHHYPQKGSLIFVVPIKNKQRQMLNISCFFDFIKTASFDCKNKNQSYKLEVACIRTRSIVSMMKNKGERSSQKRLLLLLIEM